MTGIAKESKAKYDIQRAIVLNLITPYEKDNFKREGYGYEVIEVEVTSDAMSYFATQKFPVTGNFEVLQEVRGGKLVSVINGPYGQKTA